jgi:hypothetical protein
MCLRRRLLIIFIATSTLLARADTVFDFSGQSMFGPSSGTITINTSTGLVTDVAVQVGFFDYTILDHQFSGFLNPGEPISIIQMDTFPDFDQGFDLGLPLDSLIGYDGGLVCSSSNEVGGYCFSPVFTHGVQTDQLISGYLEPQISSAATPELSTFALLGTGILVLAGAVRRKSFHVYN